MTFPRLVSIFAGISLSLTAVWQGVGRASGAVSSPTSGADLLTRDAPAERRVTPRKTRLENVENNDQGQAAQPAANAGLVDPPIIERQIHSRFTLLNDCPVEVARHLRVAPSALKGHRLTLRWTILPSGQVADTAVVATSPVDIRVMDCVKRQMSLWSFTQPHGSPMRVERPFTFRTR